MFWPVNILAIATTFVGGLIMALPLIGLIFVLLLSIMWLPFFALLLGSAWLWHRAPQVTYPLIALIGVPVALLGWVYCTLMPGGGDPDDMQAKRQKQTMCALWPYAHATDGRPLVQQVQEEEGIGFFRAVMIMTRLAAMN